MLPAAEQLENIQFALEEHVEADFIKTISICVLEVALAESVSKQEHTRHI